MDAIRLSPPRRLKLPVSHRGGTGEISVLDFGDEKRPVDLVFAHANGFNALTYRPCWPPFRAACACGPRTCAVTGPRPCRPSRAGGATGPITATT